MAIRSFENNLFTVNDIDTLREVLHTAAVEIEDYFRFMISELSMPSTTFDSTVTTQVAESFPAAAVMKAVPADTAFTTPFSMVATLSSDEVLIFLRQNGYSPHNIT